MLTIALKNHEEVKISNSSRKKVLEGHRVHNFSSFCERQQSPLTLLHETPKEVKQGEQGNALASLYIRRNFGQGLPVAENNQ